MSESALEITIRALIEGITTKRDEATSIAKAARICAESGNTEHAIQILADFEVIAHDAQDLFEAALAIRRHVLPDSA